MSEQPERDSPKTGRPSKRTPEIVAAILSGLSKGEPLTVLCAQNGVCDDTVRNWAHADEELSRAIARARDAGFDQIALDALRIADGVKDDDTDVQSRRLRADVRLKLLAKWDPKRYGERIAQEITGAEGGPIKSESTVTLAPDEAYRALLG